MLAETYATPDRHAYCPQWALEWDYRKNNILKQMKDYRGDVLCMQVGY